LKFRSTLPSIRSSDDAWLTAIPDPSGIVVYAEHFSINRSSCSAIALLLFFLFTELLDTSIGLDFEELQIMKQYVESSHTLC
jgi:hypothetical protein